MVVVFTCDIGHMMEINAIILHFKLIWVWIFKLLAYCKNNTSNTDVIPNVSGVIQILWWGWPWLCLQTAVISSSPCRPSFTVVLVFFLHCYFGAYCRVIHTFQLVCNKQHVCREAKVFYERVACMMSLGSHLETSLKGLTPKWREFGSENKHGSFGFQGKYLSTAASDDTRECEQEL